jgi:hypothetical protein
MIYEFETEEDLLDFYVKNKNTLIEVLPKGEWGDYFIELEDLFKMFKLLMQKETNELSQSSTE